MPYAAGAVLGNKLVNNWSVVLQVRYKTCEKKKEKKVKYNGCSFVFNIILFARFVTLTNLHG